MNYDEQYHYEEEILDRIRSGLATTSDAEYLMALDIVPNYLCDRVANGLATAIDADKIAEFLGLIYDN